MNTLPGFSIDKMNVAERIANITKEKEILEKQFQDLIISKDPNKDYSIAARLQQEISRLEENIVTIKAQESLEYAVPRQTDVIEGGISLTITKFPPKLNPQAQELSSEEIEDFCTRMKNVDKNDSNYNHRYILHKKAGESEGRFPNAFKTCGLLREDAFHILKTNLQEPSPSLLDALTNHKSYSGLLSSLAYITGVLSALTETAPITENDRELVDFFGSIFRSSANYIQGFQ